MDLSMLDAALNALNMIAEPTRLAFLALGVVIGLVLGAVPGIGSVAGLAIVLPFTFKMDPYTALAFLMGISSVVVNSRAIAAISLGESRTANSAVTVMDQFPKARNGEAGRALGTAYSASAMGGLIGAILLAISITTLFPALAEFDTLEFSGFYIFALAVAASFTGDAPLKALAGVCLGLLIATVGDDPQTGTLRWTFNLIDLWDGVQIIPLVLGLFALPELCDLVIRNSPNTRSDTAVLGTHMSRRIAGVRDTVRCWWLTTRCAGIGAILGAVPGMGAAVVNRVAHDRVARTKIDGADISVTGDFRSLIALAASNSARVGGALVPTIAFGVPGSASMVLILSALAFHGPELGLETQIVKLDGFYVLVWSIAIASLLGAGICLLFAQQFARAASIRIGVLVPTALALVFLGAYHGALSWSAIYTLIAGGVFGWAMKRLGWPRTPLLLGFFLGPSVEYNIFTSFERYEWDWILSPFVLAAFAVALFGIVRPITRRFLRRRDREADKSALGGGASTAAASPLTYSWPLSSPAHCGSRPAGNSARV